MITDDESVRLKPSSNRVLISEPRKSPKLQMISVCDDGARTRAGRSKTRSEIHIPMLY